MADARTWRRSYEELGLFWNPFGTVETERWSELIVPRLDLDAVATQLRTSRLAVVFRGHMGRGKSTHLRALHTRFPRAPFTYLGPEASPRTHVPAAPVCFLDEAQRLAPRLRRRLYRKVIRAGARRSPERSMGALALTSHEDLRPELEAAGYAVVESVIEGLSEASLRTIVDRRLRWAARPGVSLETLRPSLADDPLLARMHARFGDDLRSIQGALYDHLETLRDRAGDREPDREPGERVEAQV